jgi:hypothetical protein
MTRYGIYEVSESFTKDGLWKGYIVKCTDSIGKQGKLYPRTDGRENYQAKPKPVDDNSDKELEI